MRSTLALIFALITLNSCAQMTVESPAFENAIHGIIPTTTKLISVKQLKDSIEKGDLIFLDAREKDEFDVSHFPNAIWVGYNDFSIERLKGVDKSKHIVIYCSVGYRSGLVGEQIEKAGFLKVYNLYGGLFEWVNQGGQVENEKGKTQKIHGYNSNWSVFVKKGEVVIP